MQGRLFWDVAIRERPSILQVYTCKDQTLLIRGDALLILNFLLHILDGVGGLHIERDGLAG